MKMLKLLKKRNCGIKTVLFWENDLHHVDQHENTNQKSLENLEKVKRVER